MADKKEDPELDALMDRYGMKSTKAVEKQPAPKSEVPVQQSIPPEEDVVDDSPMRENPFIEMQRIQEREALNKPPENVLERNRGLAETGAVLGGVAQYKGLGQKVMRPATDLFAPRDGVPTGGQGKQMSLAPVQPVTDIEHILQSGKEDRPQVTGRQKESGHNWETNRQALAQQQSLGNQGAKQLVVNAGPMVPTSSGVAIPKNVAVQMELELQARQIQEAMAREQALQRQAIEQQRLQQQQAKRAQAVGALKGTARVGQGVGGGAIAVPQLYEYGRDVISGTPNKPADTTQGLSGLGGLMMALGRNRTGALGALAQIPYIAKNRDEISRSLRMSDVVPDTVRMGMTGSEMYDPANEMPVRPTKIR